jgi:hypothetical protein
MDRPEPAGFLPEHVRDVLRRKSSRDPNSRFTTKLHLLLAYADQVPSLRDQLGLYWVNDEEFKMNKGILSSVMGIKLNTLNVNLRDLHFAQIERDKDGSTRWKRNGFTRSSGDQTELDSVPTVAARVSPMALTAPIAPREPPGFSLGKLTPSQADNFWTGAKSLWAELFHMGPHQQVRIEAALEQTAARFKHSEQPLDNAKDVIRAIMVRPGYDLTLSFVDFSRFLAMFGPVETIMLKIASLLTCSNGSGKWLTFDPEHTMNMHVPAFARFDEHEPNCLIVRHCDGLTEKVYNDPLADGVSSSYLRDERGMRYSNWEEYLRQHPVRCGLGQFAV